MPRLNAALTICRHFPVRRGRLFIVYTFDSKKFTILFLIFKKLRLSSKVRMAFLCATMRIILYSIEAQSHTESFALYKLNFQPFQWKQFPWKYFFMCLSMRVTHPVRSAMKSFFYYFLEQFKFKSVVVLLNFFM